MCMFGLNEGAMMGAGQASEVCLNVFSVKLSMSASEEEKEDQYEVRISL